MSRKKKSGLQRGLADIVEKQTAPVENKSQLSRGLIGRFAEPKTPPTRVTGVTPVTPVTTDAAPKRDFARVANSIVRDAVPAGLFTGKGKQLYDYLYSKTRGAIVPMTTVRLASAKVMKAAGMSRPTYKTQLARLVGVGLVKIEEKGSGEHGGNLFTVFLPEEVGYPGNPRNPSDPGNNLGGLPGQETYPGNPGVNVEDIAGSVAPKTSFKTKERFDDDAALAPLREVERELTGKESSDWREVAEVLAIELRAAAARTPVISSAPRFLAEHLRRRLFRLDKKQMEEKPREGQETPARQPVDAQNCPTCKGGGWYYPDGYDKPVRRCRHESLSR